MINAALKPKIVVNVNSDSIPQDSTPIPQDSTEGKGSIISSSSMFFFTKKIPSWLKTTLLVFIGTICITYTLKYFGFYSEGKFNLISNLLSNPLAIKLIKIYFILGSISSIIMICYYILNLYLFIMFSKGKISMPIHLPQFILNWLKFIQEVSQFEEKGVFIDVYFRNILVYFLY